MFALRLTKCFKKRAKKEARPLTIHCGFIAHWQSVGMHAHPCAARKANPS